MSEKEKQVEESKEQLNELKVKLSEKDIKIEKQALQIIEQEKLNEKINCVYLKSQEEHKKILRKKDEIIEGNLNQIEALHANQEQIENEIYRISQLHDNELLSLRELHKQQMFEEINKQMKEIEILKNELSETKQESQRQEISQSKQIQKLKRINLKLDEENTELNLRMMKDLDCIVRKQDLFSKEYTKIFTERQKLNQSISSNY